MKFLKKQTKVCIYNKIQTGRVFSFVKFSPAMSMAYLVQSERVRYRMFRRIAIALGFLALLSGCKEDPQQQTATPAPTAVSGDQTTINDLRTQLNNANSTASTERSRLSDMESRVRLLCTQVQNQGLQPAATCSDMVGATANNNGVVNPVNPVNSVNGGVVIPSTGNATINSLIQVALGIIRPQAGINGGSCGPGGSNCCTPHQFKSCVTGTQVSLHCNAQGSDFEARNVSGQCGYP